MAGAPRPFLHQQAHPLLQQARREIALECHSYRAQYSTIQNLLDSAIAAHSRGDTREAARLAVRACSAEWDLTGDCKVTSPIGAALFEDWDSLHDRVLDELAKEIA